MKFCLDLLCNMTLNKSRSVEGSGHLTPTKSYSMFLLLVTIAATGFLVCCHFLNVIYGNSLRSDHLKWTANYAQEKLQEAVITSDVTKDEGLTDRYNNDRALKLIDLASLDSHVEESKSLKWDVDIPSDGSEPVKSQISLVSQSETDWFDGNDLPQHEECDKNLIKFHVVDDGMGEDFECVPLAVKPLTKVCLYPPELDLYVSSHIRDIGIWEGHIVAKFQEILKQHGSNMAVVDLGSNIGMYTLIAANMGHKVLALEPNMESIKRMDRALVINGIVDKVTIVQNAVSDHCGPVEIKGSHNNQGDVRISLSRDKNATEVFSVTLDLLAGMFPPQFKPITLKIDIQGFEHAIFQNAAKFFDTYEVAYIFMEWVLMREHYVTEVHKSHDKMLVEELISFLAERKYVPFSSVTHQKLTIQSWFGWPEDVLWILNKYL